MAYKMIPVSQLNGFHTIISKRRSLLSHRCLKRVKINFHLTKMLVVSGIFLPFKKIILFRNLKLSMNIKYASIFCKREC